MRDALGPDEQESRPGGHPILPDTPGITVDEARQLLDVEEVRKLIAAVHGTSIPVDDPILMEVTILNAYMDQQDRLFRKHEKALAALMTEQTGAYAQSVRKSMEKLEASLAGVTAEGMQSAAAAIGESFGKFKATLYMCAAIMAVSALLNMVLFMFMGAGRG